VDQALSFCQRIGGVTYVETSAKISARAAISAFEVAGLASMGKIAAPIKSAEHDAFQTQDMLHFDRHDKHQQHLSTTKLENNRNRNSIEPVSPESSLERKDDARLAGFRGDIYALEPAEQFWDQFNNSLIPSPKTSRSISAPRTPSLGSTRLVLLVIYV
jgi:hypothetical protein